MKGPAACGGCQAATCCACWFSLRQAELEAQFTVVPGITRLTVSWQPWSVGCAVCSAFGAKGKSSAYQDIRLTTRDQLRVEATAGELVGEMESVRHLAARVAVEDSLSSRDAWMRAAEMTTANKRGGVLDASRSPPSTLLQMIIRYWAAGGSTSGVEQSFGKGYNHRVASLGNDACCDRMEIVELAKGDMPQVLRLATDIWSDTFGRPRVSSLLRSYEVMDLKKQLEDGGPKQNKK